MKTLTTLTLALTLNACGSSGGSDSGSPTVTTDKKTAQPSGVTTSYYVGSEADLKACDDSSRGSLAYVQNTANFEACLASGWTVVNVKGKDGASGTTGAAGTPTAINQWYNGIDGKTWIMSTQMMAPAASDAQNGCSQGSNYRVPTKTEIVFALAHGLKAAAQALTNPATEIIPSVATVPTNAYTIRINDSSQNVTGSGAEFCISK